MSYTFSRRDFLKYSALTVVAVAGEMCIRDRPWVTQAASVTSMRIIYSNSLSRLSAQRAWNCSVGSAPSGTKPEPDVYKRQAVRCAAGRLHAGRPGSRQHGFC